MVTMTIKSDQDDLLVRLDERTKYIVFTLDELKSHADNGGWLRCREREGQIKTLEENQKSHRLGHRWYVNLVIGLGITEILALIFARWKL